MLGETVKGAQSVCIISCNCMWIYNYFQKISIYKNYFIYFLVKNLLAMQETYETRVQSLGWGYPLEESMATLSSTLGWRRPWTEPGGLQSIGLKQLSTHAGRNKARPASSRAVGMGAVLSDPGVKASTGGCRAGPWCKPRHKGSTDTPRQRQVTGLKWPDRPRGKRDFSAALGSPQSQSDPAGPFAGFKTSAKLSAGDRLAPCGALTQRGWKSPL